MGKAVGISCSAGKGPPSPGLATCLTLSRVPDIQRLCHVAGSQAGLSHCLVNSYRMRNISFKIT